MLATIISHLQRCRREERLAGYHQTRRFTCGADLRNRADDGQTIWVRDRPARCSMKRQPEYYDGSLKISPSRKNWMTSSRFCHPGHPYRLPNRISSGPSELTICGSLQRGHRGAAGGGYGSFSEINDRYGHKTGDRILQIVAGRIKSQLRKSDLAHAWQRLVHRLAQWVRNRRDVLAVATKIAWASRLRSSCRTSDSPHASIGISLYPEHGMK